MRSGDRMLTAGRKALKMRVLMRMLLWLVLAVTVSSPVVVACAPGPTQGAVTIITQIDFTKKPIQGTFEVTKGAAILGCVRGTFVDSPVTALAIHKEFTCTSGTKKGTFTAEVYPPRGPWQIVDATGDFRGLSGEGDSWVVPASESDGQTPALDGETRAAVIDDLLRRLTEKYVFADTAKKMAADIREHQQNGEYDGIIDRAAFAHTLTNHLREVSLDKHLEVVPDTGLIAGVETLTGTMQTQPEDPPPTAAKDPARVLYPTDRLPGDVGYMDLHSFPPPQSGADAAAQSAMNTLHDTDALIVDITYNTGGDPEMVALLCSYLFGPEPVHLNDIHWRRGNTFTVEEFWTRPEVAGKRYGEDKPVYVLTSDRTFSGAEEFAYDLQALGRATIVGETTGGGAHLTRPFVLAAEFTVSIPIGTAVNPITKTNWEGTGVKPDIAVPEEKALQTATNAALEKIL
jgi:hypothetical protein